jgi:hypothetical protein
VSSFTRSRRCAGITASGRPCAHRTTSPDGQCGRCVGVRGGRVAPGDLEPPPPDSSQFGANAAADPITGNQAEPDEHPDGLVSSGQTNPVAASPQPLYQRPKAPRFAPPALETLSTEEIQRQNEQYEQGMEEYRNAMARWRHLHIYQPRPPKDACRTQKRLHRKHVSATRRQQRKDDREYLRELLSNLLVGEALEVAFLPKRFRLTRPVYYSNHRGERGRSRAYKLRLAEKSDRKIKQRRQG